MAKAVRVKREVTKGSWVGKKMGPRSAEKKPYKVTS
jgi:hypothetical protein